jgi:AbrB family looped-hinge helix DNA binding protein
MPAASRVGSKGQLVIPKRLRDILGLHSGDEVIFEVVGDAVVLRRRPESYAAALRGLHGHLWHGLDVERFLEEERSQWETGENG